MILILASMMFFQTHAKNEFETSGLLKNKNDTITIPDSDIIPVLIKCNTRSIVPAGKIKQYLINTTEEFDSIFFNDCNAVPKINFETQTLLGLYTTSGGCNVKYGKKVIKVKKKIIYEVSVFPEGRCERLNSEKNFILIPKIPKDVTVEYIRKIIMK